MFFTKRKAIILIIICSIFFILTYNDVRSKEFQIISGTALVTDGDTIKINKNNWEFKVNWFAKIQDSYSST